MKQREQERSQEEERRRQERFEARDRRLEAFRKRMYNNNEEADEEVHDDDDDDDADSLDRSVPIKVEHHDFVSPDEDEDEFSSGIVKLPPPPSKEDRKAMTPENQISIDEQQRCHHSRPHPFLESLILELDLRLKMKSPNREHRSK